MISKYFSHICLFFALLSMPMSVSAQRSMDELFISMPQTLVPSLPVEARMDMVDLFRSEMEAKVDNYFDRPSVLENLNEQGFDLQVTKSSRLDARLFLTEQNDTVLAVIRTLYVPQEDSRLMFFDASWKPLDLSVELSFSDFLNLSDEAAIKQWRARLSPLHYTMKWQDGQPCVLVGLSYDRLDINYKKQLTSLLRLRTLRWTGAGFQFSPADN